VRSIDTYLLIHILQQAVEIIKGVTNLLSEHKKLTCSKRIAVQNIQQIDTTELIVLVVSLTIPVTSCTKLTST